MVPQLIQAAHICGFHLHQLRTLGVFFEQIVKNAIVVTVFRQGDFQLLADFARFCEWSGVQDHRHYTDQHQEEQRKAQVTHPGGKADGHCKKDAADFSGAARHRTEPNQVKRAHNGNAGAEVPVDEHDDRLNNHRHQGQSDDEAFAVGVAEHVAQRHADAKRHGGQRAENQLIHPHRSGGGGGRR